MIIGVPKEIKAQEYRVALAPSGVNELRQMGHQVLMEQCAGKGSDFLDEDYRNAGATICHNMQEIYEKAEMVMKVKEPLEEEYPLIRKGQIVFTFFHAASSISLTQAMMARQGICIAYETVEEEESTLPLLVPMSEVAGRMSIQQGARCLESHNGGSGVLLGGVPGVAPGRVMIIGGGVVGTEAAKMAAGLGADVTLLDKSLKRLRYLSEILPKNVRFLMANEYAIDSLLPSQNLIVGAVLMRGGKAPVVIKKEQLKRMQRGTVLVDVAVDQGGCFELSRPTTHEKPTYEVNGVIYYCVANMPGAVPHTSTTALTNATLPYAIEIANKGWTEACKENIALRKGLNIAHNKIVYHSLAEAFQLPYTPPEELLATS